MPETEHISAMMRQKRMHEGKLQAEMAAELGISDKYYGRIERGDINPRLTMFKSLANCYGTSVSDFIRYGPPYGVAVNMNSDAWADRDISAELAAISQWIYGFRQHTGETQMSLAAKIDKCIDTVGALERQTENKNPLLSTMQSIAAYMNIEVWELLDTTLSKKDMDRILKERLGNDI